MFFNSSVVAQRVTKLGALRAQHLGLNCICKIYEGVHHGEGNTVTSNKFYVKQSRYFKHFKMIHVNAMYYYYNDLNLELKLKKKKHLDCFMNVSLF